MFQVSRFKFQGKAFTLVEMMVTLSIITFLTVMILVYSRQGESSTNLIRDADKMIFELRRAQNLSMLTLQQSPSGPAICGWGIYFDKDALPLTQYILFSDFCNEGVRNKYNHPAEKLETITLLRRVQITNTNISSVIFIPPEPKVMFVPDNTISDAFISMCLLDKSDDCYEIHISPVGQIFKKLPEKEKELN